MNAYSFTKLFASSPPPFSKEAVMKTTKGLDVKLVHTHLGKNLSGHVHAYVDGDEVGHMPYGGNSGYSRIQIGDMEVSRSMRRKGVASAMLQFARDNGVDVKHYEPESDMSMSGRMFSSSFDKSTK